MKIISCLLFIGILLGDTMDNKIITTPSGLKYQNLNMGDGNYPETGDVVVVHYVGKLENGDIFDSSKERNQPFEFPLGMGRVIKGWDEGLANMKIGGKRILTIPSHLGYGKRGAGDRRYPGNPQINSTLPRWRFWPLSP